MRARYMLDTNICIYLIKHQPPHVADRFKQCRVGDVVMSAITYAELRHGAAKSHQPRLAERQLDLLTSSIPVLAFDGQAAAEYGPIRLATGNSRQNIMDKLIAAHAIALEVTLVTNNVQDFAKYPGIVTENWAEAC